jgi:hypothetical protein
VSRINQEIVEFSFSKKSTPSYELSLLIGYNSIYYLVNDAQLNILALKTFHADHQPEKDLETLLREAFYEDEILKESYRTTKIVFSTMRSTLVPNRYFKEENLSEYFENLTELPSQAVLSFDNLKTLEVKNVFATELRRYNLVKSIFPESQIFHSQTALITGFQKVAEQRKGHQVFANLRDGWLQICFFDDKNLLFSNSFEFHSSQDFIYYIMLVYEQFKLNPEAVPLSLSGFLVEGSDIFRLVFRYIRHVSFLTPPAYFRFGNQFTGVPHHFFFDLFSIKLCE